MIVKSAEIECRGPMMKTGVCQLPIRAYMDNLTVTTTSVMGSRWILRSLEKLIAWARMKFKLAKSRSFIMKKGRTADKFHFSIVGTMIPTLLECPIKSLGKIFDTTLRDTNAVRAAVGDLELWLTRVDESGLPGRFKAWIYQHEVHPRILWPLFVYDSPMTIVEAMERKINNYLRRSYLPTPPLGQDMTQGQFLSGVWQVWIQSFPSPRLVASPRLKNLVCPTIYP